jgi:hypothetical protein
MSRSIPGYRLSREFRLRNARCIAVPFFFLFVLLFVLFPREGVAQGLLQGISASLEFNYNYLSAKTTDASGNTVKTAAQVYNPRFQLDINTAIFPNLRLRTGGLVEGIISDVTSGGSGIRTTQINFRPYIDLTLETPLYTASIGYFRRQQTTEVTHSGSTTLTNDDYYTILRWRPAELPSMDLQLKHDVYYDDTKSILNTTQDLITLNSKYQYKGFLLDYYGTYQHTQDKINDLDVTQYSNSARAAFSDSFLDKRVAVNTTYNILYQETRIESTGAGLVSSQVFPFGGLSSLDDTPLDGPLDPNPALIDGDLNASAGINIGLPPPGGDIRLRNMGLDFLTPTGVNRLLLWTDRDLSIAPNIVNFFSSNLKVYVSSDNLNWVAWPITPPITFGPLENRFEIKFATVVPARRYIKVVTPPLNPAVAGAFAFPVIFVTELQAFVETPAKNLKNRFSTTTQNADLDVKTRILDIPTLFYEFYSYYNRQDPIHQQQYTISNALSTFYRFNEVFSGRAKVALENGEDLSGLKRFAYIYDAALTADPLRTLHSSFVVNGRDEKIDGKPNNLNSIFLYNTAQLYKGIDVSLNAGVNFLKQVSGESGRDFVINLQANIVPHRTLTLGLNYNTTISHHSTMERGSFSNYQQELDITLSYNPFTTLNLYAFIQVIGEKAREVQTLQNYAINWSPFPGGALQFYIAYNENYRSEDRLKERIFYPSIRYNLSKRSYVQLSYQLIRSRSDIQKIDSNLISASVKLFY